MTLQYLSIQDGNLSPSGSFTAYNSVNAGNNLGWSITGSSPLGTYARLTKTGNLLVNASYQIIFDEVNNTKIQLSATAFYAELLDEVLGYINGSLRFNGSSYLSVPNSVNITFGSSNFTIECWVYVDSSAGTYEIVNTASSTTNESYAVVYSSGVFYYYLSSTGTTWDVASAISMGAGVAGHWYHIALVRNGSTYTPYVNGVAGTTATSAASLFAFTTPLNIGTWINSGTPTASLSGNITNLRIVNGVAVYTSNFAPPTLPLTAIASTALLLNVFSESTIVTDSSVNNISVTNIGVTYSTLAPPKGVAMRQTKTGNVLVSGIFDEIQALS